MPYIVFAQQEEPMFDAAAVARHAAQFFAAEIELEGSGADLRARLGGDARRCVGRAADGADVAAAERAEAHAGFTGLSLLARRCKSVWAVETEGEDDEVALRIAAILASVALGPILSPDGAELFGVRTARAKLERAS